MIEHRLTYRLHKYWNLLRRNHRVPRFAMFNPLAISDLWGNCILLQVLPRASGHAPVLTFAEIGEKLRSIYQDSMEGETFSVLHTHFQGARIVRRVQEVILSGEWMLDEGVFVSESHKVVKFRSCLMPFCGKDGRITHVVIGLTWREA